MSNTQVGNVYQQIIADVVESSRVDFEEGGVDEGVLEELRLVSVPFLCCAAASICGIKYFPLHLPRVILFILRCIFRCLRVLSSVEDMGVDDSFIWLGWAAAWVRSRSRIDFSRVGTPLYLALYPAFRLKNPTQTLAPIGQASIT
jgi:hypothetical protein